MTAGKVASILLVAIVSLTILNSLLKYYTYFVLVVAAHKSASQDSDQEDSGAVPHPHELYVPFLTFIPTLSPLLVRPWVLVTAGLIEDSLVLLGFTLMAVFNLGRFLEGLWGLQEFLRFVMTVLVLSNLAIYLYYSFKTAIFGAGTAVPPVVISGVAVVMALLVAVKQRISDHYVILFRGSLRIKVTYLPFILLVALGFLYVVSDNYKITWLLALVGFATSWVYLRYFKSSSNERQSYLLPFTLRRANAGVPPVPLAAPTLTFDNNLSRGDRSDLFALATFFPGPIASVVLLVSNGVFRFMIKRKWVDPKDYTSYDGDTTLDDVGSVQSKLFSLSALKGAEDVSPIPNAGNAFNTILAWFTTKESVDIKDSMDKRRKLAIRELD